MSGINSMFVGIGVVTRQYVASGTDDQVRYDLAIWPVSSGSGIIRLENHKPFRWHENVEIGAAELGHPCIMSSIDDVVVVVMLTEKYANFECPAPFTNSGIFGRVLALRAAQQGVSA